MSSQTSRTLTPLDNINTLQALWDQTIKYQQAGEQDTNAMMAIYPVINPRLTFQDIANVFSGVYADTYWNTTFLDASLLAKSMVQGLGLTLPLAQRYAQLAMTQWRGTLLRKNISDTGVIPVLGDFTGSLDIVCNGDTPVNPANLIANWNDSYWQTPQVGKNFVYARCQNMAFRGPMTPQVQMFYSTGGFNQPPTSWIQCTTADANLPTGQVLTQQGKKGGALALGDRGCSEAFMFNPTSADHVCVIAAMTSEFFTENTPLGGQGNFDSLNWITHNGAAAWHNVDPQRATVDKLAFYNQDGNPEQFNFVLTCRNVPVGSTIRLSSDDAKLGFDSGDIKVHSSAQLLSQTVTLPANYAGELKVKLEDPSGACLPVNAAAEVRMEWVLPQAHLQRAQVAELIRAPQLLLSPQPLSVTLGTFTLVGAGK